MSRGNYIYYNAVAVTVLASTKRTGATASEVYKPAKAISPELLGAAVQPFMFTLCAVICCA